MCGQRPWFQSVKTQCLLQMFQQTFTLVHYFSGDAVTAICSAANCGGHLSHMGFTKGSVCHCPLSINHSSFPGSEVTGLWPAHWRGRSSSMSCCVSVIRYVMTVINMISNTGMLSQSSEAAEGCVTVKYSLAGHRSQNQLHFSLKPAGDTG